MSASTACPASPSDRGLGRLFRGLRACAEDRAESRDASCTAALPTVMVVDDDAPIRDTVCLALSSRGYRVLRAMDGEEALSLMEGVPGGVHVLLTDVIMPRLDGPGLAAAVARRHPRTRVIFMSGYENRVPANRRRLTSSQFCLFKPFSLMVLETALNNALASNSDDPDTIE